MPIRINLLAEEQHEAELRRRDPVKRAVTVAAVIVACVVGYYAWLLTQKGLKSAAVDKNKQALTAIEADAAVAREALSGVTELEKRIHALNNLSTNRVLWGTFMNALQQVAMKEVPVSQFRVIQDYRIDRPPPQGKIPMPATAIQQISVGITARDYGRPQQQLYNQFRQKMLGHEWLKEQLDEENGVTFEPFGTRTPDRNDPSRSFLPFTMKVNFKQLEFR